MSKSVSYLIVVLLILTGLNANGQDSGMEQDPVLIRLKARIVSAGDSMPIPYVNIVYPRNRTGTSSNAGGFFSIEMLNLDSLSLSAMGFKTRVVKIPPRYSEATILTIFMQPIVYAIREVQVTAEKPHVNMDGIPVGKSSGIAPELRGDAFNEKPPVLAALFNPISYWQYFLSRREKQKRRVREAIAIEKNWEMHSQNYNKGMVKLLTGLRDQEAEEFMIWFNAQNVLPYTSTEYEVRAAIKNYYEIYRKEKNSD
jgi:hypothetical protein